MIYTALMMKVEVLDARCTTRRVVVGVGVVGLGAGAKTIGSVAMCCILIIIIIIITIITIIIVIIISISTIKSCHVMSCL